MREEVSATMTSVMPLVSSSARASEAAAIGRSLTMPSKPFFNSTTQSSWITPATQPPAGDWQLAPAGIVNPFALGSERLHGDAVYSSRDRKMTAANGPIVVTVRPDLIGDEDEQSRKPVLLKAGTPCVIFESEESTVLLYNTRDGHGNAHTKGFIAADTVWEPADPRAGLKPESIPIVVHGECDGKVQLAGNPGTTNAECTVLQPSSSTQRGTARIYIH